MFTVFPFLRYMDSNLEFHMRIVYLLCLSFIFSSIAQGDSPPVYISATFDLPIPQKVEENSPISFNIFNGSTLVVSDFEMPPSIYSISYNIASQTASYEEPSIFGVFNNNILIEGTICTIPIADIRSGLSIIIDAKRGNNVFELRALNRCTVKDCSFTVSKVSD